MEIGSKIKKIRESKGLTQKQLAEKIGVTPVTITRYENDNRKPDFDTLEKIADYFNVSIDYLLGRTDSKEIISNPKKDTSVEKISESLSDDPELANFWNTLKEREDLKLLFKQTKDMVPNDIKKIVRIIKAIEDEEDKNDG
ncbi:helix-turn-helix domain-containing protein [Clostridium fermenticellae]|uniref:Helix-turn-helix domain-containing protein n=1 Tax=Clostridium fermenticellae TaxID=2068654 RepID=A0A386H238_9CLOT|nr:helix-turn-helix domain-containing protein [Clostridium fermenticellae]AYD39598.1 helix-turn-helix domain-containing protein [Clostridium fermenticellae]AYD39613.1 helix-turn-helix domain-containing protein [Clostridium fermenticellae]